MLKLICCLLFFHFILCYNLILGCLFFILFYSVLSKSDYFVLHVVVLCCTVGQLFQTVSCSVFTFPIKVVCSLVPRRLLFYGQVTEKEWVNTRKRKGNAESKDRALRVDGITVLGNQSKHLTSRWMTWRSGWQGERYKGITNYFFWAVPRNNIPALKPFNECSTPLISKSHGGGDRRSVLSHFGLGWSLASAIPFLRCCQRMWWNNSSVGAIHLSLLKCNCF